MRSLISLHGTLETRETPLNGAVTTVLKFHLELIYGGFWEHEHRSVDTGQQDHASSHTPSSGVHKQHTLAMTLLLQSRGREDFQQLVRCVEGVKDLWPDLEEKEGSLRFMKHFYYEVSVALSIS